MTGAVSACVSDFDRSVGAIVVVVSGFSHVARSHSGIGAQSMPSLPESLWLLVSIAPKLLIR